MRKLYLSLFAFLFVFAAQAQVGLYSFSQSAGTYTALSGATTSTATGDDGTQNVSIGFNFNFGGVTYTNAVLSTNGDIKLAPDATTAFPTSWTNNLSNTYGAPIVGAIWEDNNATGGSVNYATTGAVGSRVFAVEWNNIHLGGTGSTTTPTASFQLRLFEGTNVIQIIYGTLNTFTTVTASIGLNDLTSFLSVTPGSPATASNATANNNITSNTGLTSGVIYTFTPPAACSATPTAGTAVANPTSVCAGNTSALSLTGASAGAPGLSYQWQSSPNNSTWTDITGATSSTYNAVVANNTWYRAVLTCAGNGSSNSVSTQVTVSAPIPLSLFEGFNTTGTAVFPTCWSQQYVVGTSNITFQTNTTNPTTVPFEGTRYVYWNSFSIANNNETRLVSPKIATTGTNSVDVEFYMYNNNNTNYSAGQYLLEGVQVQYSLDGVIWVNAGSLFTRHDAALAAGTGLWQKKSVTLPAAAGNQAGVFVGFKFHSGFGDNTSMDAVRILPTPSCPAPSAVAVGSVTNTAGSVTFTCTNCTGSYVVEYGPVGFTPGTGATAGTGGTVVAGTASPIALSGLTGSTTYDVYVRQNCGATFSLNSAPAVAFTTLCTPATLSTTTPGQRCGPGTVTLSATGSAGASFNWYTAATGGSPIATAPFFTTPVLNSSVTYYVSASNGGTSGSVGRAAYTGTDGTNTAGAYLIFNAISSFTLNSVVIYPSGTGAGTVTIQLQNSAGTVLQSATVNVTGAATPVATTVPVGFSITPGTAYRLVYGSSTGGVTAMYREFTAIPFPYTLPGVVSITDGSLAGYYYYFYNWSVSTGCESARTAVTATVNPGPTFTVSGTTTACSNGIKTLTVTSPAANFNSVTWSPTAGLFTDAAATTAYTGGNASTVYVKQATAGLYTYVATGINSATSCSGIDSVKVTVLPATLTIATSSPQICVSGTTTLSVSTPAGFGNATFQWLQSPTGTGYTNITGATNSTYTTPTISTAGFYQVIVKDPAGNSCLQPTVNITVNNPQVLTTTPATNCAASASVTLGATVSAGSTATWYTVASGGTPAGSGTSFTTPTLTGPTTYYVAASSGNYTVGVGKPNTTGADGTASTTGAAGHLKFDALSAFTLNSVVIYPAGTGTGTVTIAYQDATGVTLTTSGPITVTGYATPTPVTIPLGFAIAPGTQLRLTLTGITGGVTGLYRDLTGNAFPYTLPNKVSITDGSTAGTYFYFYNWQITTTCESARTAVLAAVNAPTTITTQPVNQSVCASANITLSVVATGAALTYQWFNGANAITGATNSTYVINNATPANSGAYKVVVTGSCGTPAVVTSNTVNIVVAPSNSWIGVANNDWNNAANWCGSVPNSTTDVVIPANTPFSPVISSTADVRNITINTGATLTVQQSGFFNIYGNYANSGTLSAATGYVAFRGAAGQTVESVNAGTILLNGTGGITLSGNMTAGTLILTNGNVTLGTNNLTLNGTVIGSAASHIITNGTGSVISNNITNNAVTIPVGADATSYNPVIITGGAGRNYTVRVAVGVNPTLNNNCYAINRTWTVTPSSAVATPVDVTLQYADADKNSCATPNALMEAGVNNGTAWVLASGVNGLVPVGTTTARQVTLQTTAFGPMAVWSPGAFSFPTAVVNVDADVSGMVLMPSVVSSSTVLRVEARRAMKVSWQITDANGRVVMTLSKSLLSGRNDITLQLGHLSSGVYQVVGYTDKGKTQVLRLIRQ
jgi:hypothetical protein